jgi:myo-inositol 2-dehydrogenase/D-chiro-inositol 1-dehydrogenase
VKDLRVAVVGAGRMGSDHITRLAERTAGAYVSAIVEPDESRAAAAAKEAPDAQVFSFIEEAIAADALDAALIATPGQFHAPVLEPALDAKLPILCEKPLTQDSDSSWEIIEREQKLDKPHIQVGFMRRFDTEYQQLRNLIASGESGDLLMVRGVHRNPDVPDDYTQHMLITDSVVHEFDVVPWLAGSRVVNVEVKYAKRNSLAPERLREPILVLMELENGVTVDVEMNVNVRFGYQVATEAVFEHGIARIGQPAGMQQWRDGRYIVAEHESFVTRFASAYDAQVQRWVDAVRRGDLVDGPNAWDGYLVALNCEAGVKALDNGGIVSVDAPDRPAFYAD